MRLVATLLCIALAACDQGPRAEAQLAHDRAYKRKTADEAMLRKGVVVTTMEAGLDEVVMLEIPFTGDIGLVEVQRCFVFRDAIYRAVSMQCPKDASPP